MNMNMRSGMNMGGSGGGMNMGGGSGGMNMGGGGGGMNMGGGGGGSGSRSMGGSGSGGDRSMGGGGGGGRSMGGGGDSEDNYISYANLLKENFEGTSLDNLQTNNGNNGNGNDNKSESKKKVRIIDVSEENDNEGNNDELIDLIKDNVISKKNKKGIKKIEKEAKSFFNINYKEFALLFFIYFLLSQEMIKDCFAIYFTSLNPDDSGRIGIKGVIIYGLLLTTLFIILRNYFL
jgi:hypothetical protein